jgi:hypothetical protein
VQLKSIFHPTLLVVAVVYGVLRHLAALASLAGFLMWFMITLSLFRYSYHVLHEVARGRTNLGAPDIESTNPVGELAFAMHGALFTLSPVMFILMPRIIGEGPLAEFIRAAGLLVVLGAFPASVALMAMTRNITAALNPASILGVIRVVGLRYALLLLWCGAIVYVAGNASDALRSGFLTPFLAEVIGVWAFLALFVVVGMGIGERSAEFGFQLDEDVRRGHVEGDRHRIWQSTLDRAYASIRSGFVSEGYGTIKQLIAAERDSLDVYQWTFNKMLDWEDRTHAVELARLFVVRLVDEKKHRAALALVDQCRKLSPGFAPPPDTLAALSAYARTIGRPRLAEELAAVSPRAPTP